MRNISMWQKGTKMLTILGWFFGVMLLLVVTGVVVIFGSMIFQKQITTVQLKLSQEVILLLDGIQVTEISDKEQPLPYEYRPGTGDVPAAKEMLLSDDGKIEEGQRTHDGDPRKEVHVLLNGQGSQPFVFKGNEVYRFDNYRLGEQLGTFTSPAFRHIGHVAAVTNNVLLVQGYPALATNEKHHLYQVSLPDFSQKEITEDSYYVFLRPPMVFTPAGFNGVVVVYYTGDYSFALGGDASRPKYSVIRIYNKNYSEGQDVTKLGFKAGTVVNVSWQNDALILQADPSLPAMADKPRVDARVWRVVI